VKGELQVAKDATWATLVAVHNGVAVLRYAANRTKSYAVNAATAAQLQGSIGQPLAFTRNGRALVLASTKP
jgi:hypothetical protein